MSVEDSLRAAIEDGQPGNASVTVTRSVDPTRLNGNNVNIDLEILDGTETALRQELAVQGLNSKYGMLRTAITGR